MIPLYNVKLSIRAAQPVTGVVSAPGGEALPFTRTAIVSSSLCRRSMGTR